MLKDQLKFLRKAQKLTQEQVANFIGVKRVAYTSYEAGRTSPSLNILIKLANLYNVSTDFLLGNLSQSNIVFNDTSSSYNRDDNQSLSIFDLTKEECELIAFYRISENKPVIMKYVKKNLNKKED